jgi:catechol 2,3-dioxygenase-like lactoylglutathione lyase family enzyme
MSASKTADVSAECLTPILYVKDFKAAAKYYTEKLLFNLVWDWGKPPTLGCVKLDKVEIFFCLGGQGCPGTWLSIFLDDIDGYHDRIKKLGAEVIYGPKDEPWGVREIHVRDPNGHVIRFGQGIPSREPKLEIERVPLAAKIEKRLAALIEDVARHKDMNVGEMLEETLLHSMEQIAGEGVASPHTAYTHRYIESLRKKHGIDYDCHASYRFVEKSVARGAKKTSSKRRKK